MMAMTTDAIELSGSLQALVDSRLDTIDRMLMGRMPRQERMAIVREVEAQIFDLLQERGGEDITREDVLAVLARLDPPEAYLPEETAVEPISPRATSREQAVRPARRGDPKVARISGILGLVMMVLALFSPVLGYGIAIPFQSLAAFWVVCGIVSSLAFVSGIIAFVLAIYSRMASAWAGVGVVTSSLSWLFAPTLPALALYLFG
jgi:hypothetical protein